MATLRLTLATRDYDFVTPIATGDVTADGIDLTLVRSFATLQRVLCEEQHAQALIPRPLDPDSVFAEFEALVRSAGP